MESLRIYRVTDHYVRFLHKTDSRVMYNKSERRPYVGIVLDVGSYQYFVPMESPKSNHTNLKKSTFIMPIAGGEYGILGFNNMIPIPRTAIIEFDIDAEPDAKYAELLRHQVRAINQNKDDVLHRAARTYRIETTSKAGTFYKRVCCDFKKLEAACKQYNPNYGKRP